MNTEMQTEPFHPASIQELDPEVRARLDEAVCRVAAHKAAWVTLQAGERRRMLSEMHDCLGKVAERWVESVMEAKAIERGSMSETSERVLVGTMFRFIRVLERACRDIETRGRASVPGPTTRQDGRVIAQVFPQARYDRLVYPGLTAEVWLEPGAGLSQMGHGGPADTGRVQLVLGAGNAGFLLALDVLSKLFVENSAVVLKMNPVNAYLAPLVEEIFAPFVREGYLQVVCGGAAEGSYLCYHPEVDAVHLTGSAQTYEAIAFGPGAEGAQRKAGGDLALRKPFTAELGNITPVIVVPGPWSPAEIRAQAAHVVTLMLDNSGSNCLTPRVIIQHRAWPGRRAFLDALAELIGDQPTRLAYYPRSAERHAAFVAAHPEARLLGRPRPGHLPWTLIADVDPARSDDICFRVESFCSVWAETALEGGNSADFVERAVAFANDTLWGNLVAMLIVHPASLKEPGTGAAVERAIADLRYGTVAVNEWSAMASMLGVTGWGAYPGNCPADIQSGAGFTGNFLMLDHIQKNVIRRPFHKRPDPLAITTRNNAAVGRRMMRFEEKPGPGRLLSLLAAAMQG